MERVIKLLVEYDNRGRELVQQAQQARLETLARLDEDKRAIQQQMRAHAAERVEQVRQQAQRDRDEALAGLRAKNEQRMQALRRVYTARHDEWLRQIVGRCIGRGRRCSTVKTQSPPRRARPLGGC